MIGIVIFQIILIMLNAVFACAEIAVLSVSEVKLEKMAEEGDKRAKRLRKLTREPAKFLATIQVAITLSGFLGSAFAADSFSEPLVKWMLSLGVKIDAGVLDAIAVVLITLVLSYFTLVFGELVPKRLAMKKAESIAMGISGPVRFISALFRPIVWLLSASTNLVLRLFGVDPNEVDEQVSEDDIRMMVDAGEEKGTIEAEEREFIQNVFEFNDITAGEIATHRTDVAILWMEDDESVWEEIIHKNRFTLYPICDGSSDNIVGILNAKDYFRLPDHTRERVMEEAVSPAYFVPETIKADVLFRNMKSSHNPMAIVLDEYGGMEGIVTINDLVEELVGELTVAEEPQTEEERSEPHIEALTETTWGIHGNVLLSDLSEAIGVNVESEDYDTFTGFVFNALGVIPEDGNNPVELDLERLYIRVTSIDAHQIEEATVTVKEIENPEEEE